MSTRNPVRFEVFFSGRVQGVGFRYTTRAIAVGYQVAGFVKNLSDGRVQVVAEGESEEVERFLDEIRRTFSGRIRDSQELVGPATGDSDRFEIRF